MGEQGEHDLRHLRLIRGASLGEELTQRARRGDGGESLLELTTTALLGVAGAPELGLLVGGPGELLLEPSPSLLLSLELGPGEVSLAEGLVALTDGEVARVEGLITLAGGGRVGVSRSGILGRLASSRGRRACSIGGRTAVAWRLAAIDGLDGERSHRRLELGLVGPACHRHDDDSASPCRRGPSPHHRGSRRHRRRREPRAHHSSHTSSQGSQLPMMVP